MATSFKIEVIKTDGTKQLIHNGLAISVETIPTAFKIIVDGKVMFDGPAANVETTKTEIPVASTAAIATYPPSIVWGKEFSMSGPFVLGSAGVKDIQLLIHATSNRPYASAKRDETTKTWVINNIKFDRSGDKLMRIVIEDLNGNKSEAQITIIATDPIAPQPQPQPQPQPTPTTELPPSVGPVLQAANLDDMFSKLPGMGVGQWVEVADGTFNNTIRRAISKAGVIVKAKNKGKVTITGQPIDLTGAGATMHGFVLKHAAPATGLTLSGKDALLSHNVINLVNSGTSKWIVVKGAGARIENNEIFGKTTKEQLIQVNAPDVKILGNNVHDFTGMFTVSSECVMVGNSTNANVDYRCEIAFNRFEKIASEDELFTIKSCRNYIHDNTFVDNLSGVTLRHGHHNRFENNILIGTGFRMYGYNQEVKNNQMIDNPNPDSGQQCLIIGAGVVGGDASAGYEQVHDCVFERNIIVKTVTSPTPLVLGFGSGNGPTKNTFKENIVYGTLGTLTAVGKGSWTDQTMIDNIVFATGGAIAGNMPAQNVDPKLTKNADGTYKYRDWKQGKYLSKSDVGPGTTSQPSPIPAPLPIPPPVVIPPIPTPQPTPAGNKDKNGLSLPVIPELTALGLKLEVTKETFTVHENFRSDGRRWDWEGLCYKSKALMGIWTIAANAPNDEVSAKLNGGPHNDNTPEYADTMDMAICDLAGTKRRLRWERDHPKYTSSIRSKAFNVGDCRGKSRQYCGGKVNLDLDKDGQFDHFALFGAVSEVDARGNPLNAWNTWCEIFTPAEANAFDGGLKSYYENWVCTQGLGSESQETMRIDGTQATAKFTTCKEIKAV